MSFDVHLIASSETPEPEAFVARTDGALAALGATGSVADVNVQTAQGATFELFAEGGGGAMFALRGLHPSIGEAIFAVADATACFVYVDEGVFLRTPANGGQVPDNADDMTVEPVADGKALFERITGGYGAWSDYRDQIVSNAAPPLSEPDSPPPSPAPVKKGWFARLFSKS